MINYLCCVLGENITYFSAFVAGILSFISPCILPLIPSYLALISGISLIDIQQGKKARSKIFFSALAFCMGFGVIFTFLGATATSVGNFLFAKSGIFTKIGGAIVIILGLATGGILDIPFLRYEKKLKFSPARGVNILTAFLVGVVFALGWSPCIGPILAAILALASTQDSVSQGIKLLLVYSSGLAIPFLAVSIAVDPFLRMFKNIRKYVEVVELVSGKLLVVMGMMLFLGTFSKVSEVMGEVTLLSTGILITFVAVAVTQVWILIEFVNWMHEQNVKEFTWAARIMFFLDILSVALLQVINVFKQYMPE